MDITDYDNDYYTGKFAGFLLTTTLFLALLFSWQSMKLNLYLPKISLLVLTVLILMTMFICGKAIFHLPKSELC